MFEYLIPQEDQAPVVIGGLGGSGTRVVTRLMQEFGVSMGGHLNGSLDNLWFSLLMVRRSILDESASEITKLLWLFNNAMRQGQPIPKELSGILSKACAAGREPVLPLAVLNEARESMVQVSAPASHGPNWGWKQPNTHIMVPILNRYYPGMKFIYVARNGLDMAFSENQNQLKYFWGDLLLGNGVEPNSITALRYWVESYKRILKQKQLLGDRLLILNYDRLCSHPLEQLGVLRDFLALEGQGPNLSGLLPLISPPGSLGRYRQQDCSSFNADDVDFVRAQGFEVTGV